MRVRTLGPRAILAALFGASAGMTGTAAAQQGSLLVRVVDGTTGAPVEQAQAFIVGTTTGGLTNAEGRFLFRVIPAGVRVVRVRARRLCGAEEATRDPRRAAGAKSNSACSNSRSTSTPSSSPPPARRGASSLATR